MRIKLDLKDLERELNEHTLEIMVFSHNKEEGNKIRKEMNVNI